MVTQHTSGLFLVLVLLPWGSLLLAAAPAAAGSQSSKEGEQHGASKGLAGLASTIFSEIDTVIHAVDVVAPEVFEGQAAPAGTGSVTEGHKKAGGSEGQAAGFQAAGAKGQGSCDMDSAVGQPVPASAGKQPQAQTEPQAQATGGKDGAASNQEVAAQLAQEDALVKEAERAVERLQRLQVESPPDGTPHAAYEQAVSKVAQAEQQLAGVQPPDPALKQQAEQVLQDAEDRLRDAAVYEYHGARATAVHEAGVALEEVQDAGRLVSTMRVAASASHLATPVFVPQLVATLHRGLPALNAWALTLRNVRVFEGPGPSDTSAESDETRLATAQQLMETATAALATLRVHEEADPHATSPTTQDAVRAAASAYAAARQHLQSWEALSNPSSSPKTGTGPAPTDTPAPGTAAGSLGTGAAGAAQKGEAAPAGGSSQGAQQQPASKTHADGPTGASPHQDTLTSRSPGWLQRIMGWAGIGKQRPKQAPQAPAASPVPPVEPEQAPAGPDYGALHAEAEQVVLAFHAEVQDQLVAVQKLLASYGIRLEDAGSRGSMSDIQQPIPSHAAGAAAAASGSALPHTTDDKSAQQGAAAAAADGGPAQTTSAAISETAHHVADTVWAQVEAGVDAVRDAVLHPGPFLQAVGHDAVVAAASAANPHVDAATSGVPMERTS